MLSKETNIEKTIEFSKRLSSLQDFVDKYFKIEKLINSITDSLELFDECENEEKIELEKIIDEEYQSAKHSCESLYLETLLNGKYDRNNAIMSLHSGAGGTESYDFVNILFRMYDRFFQKEKYKTEILDIEREDVGIKSITIKIFGENAYGKLKSEKGVHRLVRISPFDSNKRRHTTFASVEVIPEIENNTKVEINPQDIKIDTFRSGGAGGQHINKTDSAVRITHIPTNIVVTCQNQRSQIQNKETALNVLKSKLVAIMEKEHLSKLSEISGNLLKIEWGNQIRSYVFCPYRLVKDHRTNFETSDVESVLDGNIDEFILSFLTQKNINE